MNYLELTYRNYKKFVKAVPLDYSGAGFNCFKITIEEVIDSIFGGHSTLRVKCNVLTTLFESCKIKMVWTVDRIELVANNLVQKSEKACHLFDGLFLFTEIKGRVERDCLNSLQSILSVQDSVRIGLLYKVARMGNKRSYTLLRKPNRGLYHTS